MATKPTADANKKSKAIRECIAKYNLPENKAIDNELLEFEGTPSAASIRLACLILTYKREATPTELKKVSDQPAAMIRELRKDGFIFKSDSTKPSDSFYRNSKGERCRQIIGFKSPKIDLKGKVKIMVEKSVSACVSAIEIYNKPDFKYREENFSVLLINAWELLLKAKIVSEEKTGIKAIYAIEKGKIKLSAGNPITIGIRSAIDKLFHTKKLDARCKANIELLIAIRDNAIHFVNKEIAFSKKVQEIGMASLQNYVRATDSWFGRSLAEYNFFLMPMSFFHPTEMESYSLTSPEEQMGKFLECLSKIESHYPDDEDNPYCVTLKIKTNIVRSNKAAAIAEIRVTQNEDAPAFRTLEEDEFQRRHPVNYKSLVATCRDKYKNFKLDSRFHSLRKQFEDKENYGEKYCRVRHLDFKNKTDKGRKFYSPEIFKEFDKYYS